MLLVDALTLKATSREGVVFFFGYTVGVQDFVRGEYRFWPVLNHGTARDRFGDRGFFVGIKKPHTGSSAG